jgi:hypothetical protein
MVRKPLLVVREHSVATLTTLKFTRAIGAIRRSGHFTVFGRFRTI